MGIFDELKSVGKALQEAGKIEQYQQILETQEKLLEMQKRIFELENENKKLKENRRVRESLILRADVYFLPKSDGTEDGPFCTKCFDVDVNLVRVHSNEDGGGYGWCPNCKVGYKIL